MAINPIDNRKAAIPIPAIQEEEKEQSTPSFEVEKSKLPSIFSLQAIPNGWSFFESPDLGSGERFSVHVLRNASRAPDVTQSSDSTTFHFPEWPMTVTSVKEPSKLSSVKIPFYGNLTTEVPFTLSAKELAKSYIEKIKAMHSDSTPKLLDYTLVEEAPNSVTVILRIKMPLASSIPYSIATRIAISDKNLYLLHSHLNYNVTKPFFNSFTVPL